MAAIRRKCENIVFTSGNTLAVLDFRTRLLQFLQVPTVEEVNPPTDEDKEEKEERLNTKADNSILASAFSYSGLYFAVCDNEKQLHLFVTKPEWNLRDTRSLVRRCTCVVFTKDDSSIIVGDKCGDVYQLPLSDPSQPAQLILGHLSMLLDLVLVHNDEYIVTCDRDEKIRISCFPNAYNIHSFCLGHTEFVGSLVYAEDSNLLISSSGDCSIRVWSLDGKEQCSIKSNICKSSLGTGSPSSPNADHSEDSSHLTEDSSHLTEDSSLLTEDSSHLTEQPAIQKIVYSKKCKVLAVSISRQACVELYQLKISHPSVTLTLLQTLTFTTDPWDIVFDDLHLLWVLLPVEESSLRVFELKEIKENNRVVTAEESADSDVEACKLIVNKYWKFFKDALEKPSVLPSLWKQRIDNVSDYLIKKQQRLQGGANGEDGKVKSVPPKKKVKAL